MLDKIDKSRRYKVRFQNKYSMFALLVILLVVIGCSSSDSADVTDEGNDTTIEQTGEKKAPAKKQGFNGNELAGVFAQKRQVGRFKQVKISRSDDDSQKIFKNSSGEALGMYMGKSKAEGVMYVLASYPSKEKAVEEFKNFIDREKDKGAKMLTDIKTDELSINANYKKGKVSIISFCNWKISNLTMCHSIASPAPKTTLDFYDAWFGK